MAVRIDDNPIRNAGYYCSRTVCREQAFNQPTQRWTLLYSLLHRKHWVSWPGYASYSVFFAWIGGIITYKLIAILSFSAIFFLPILYLENERVTSQLNEEITESRTFRHALIFLALAIMVGSVGWIVGTGMHTFIEIAVPKLTLL